MSIENSGLRTISQEITLSAVPLSRWVNERFPPWSEILTSHEVARLTRRHCWTLATLSLFGKFPKKLQFRGRPIGWLRAEVDEWLDKRSLARSPCSKVRRNSPRYRRDLAHFSKARTR
jgi:predicted DNA-binding transcriptional regulator AlpA